MKKMIVIFSLGILLFNNLEKINYFYFYSKLLKNELNNSEIYYYDLNGDGKKEAVKLESYKDKDDTLVTNLYINNKLKNEYRYKGDIKVYIYDFNKMDRNKEIYAISDVDDSKTNIFVYEDDQNYKNYSMSGKIISSDDKNGTIKIANGSISDSSFKDFNTILGGKSINIDYNYKRVLQASVEDIVRIEVGVASNDKEKEYRVIKDTTVYETNIGNVKAYNLLEGQTVKLVSLYNSDKDKCIKVVNEEGRYGWIKIEDKQVFE